MLITLGRGLSPVNTAKFDLSLKPVLPSTVFHVDATLAASYPGSGQVLANIVSAPADGSVQSAYDFYLGATSSASTDDPTFNGSAGASSAYFSVDGGDFFSLKSGTNTTFLNALHKTTGGTSWWCAFVWRPVDIAGTDFFFSTSASSGNLRGMGLFQNGSENVTLQQRGDTASVNPASIPSAVTPGTDYVVIFSCDTAGNVRRWLNSATKTTHTWTLNTSTTDAGQPLRVGGRTTSNLISNGTRIYALAMGNAYIDNADAAKIFAYFNTRHSRTYA